MGFSSETLEARRKQHDMFQVRKEEDCQPQILSRLYKNILPTLSENILQGQRKIQTFSGEGKLREPVTGWPALKGGWKGVLRAEQKGSKREPHGIKREGRTPFTKIWINVVGAPSPPESYKLHLVVEAEILTVSNMVLNALKGSI